MSLMVGYSQFSPYFQSNYQGNSASNPYMVPFQNFGTGNQQEQQSQSYNPSSFINFKPGNSEGSMFGNIGSDIKSSINNFGTNFGLGPGTLSYTGVALPWMQPGMIANPVMAGEAGVSATTGALGTGASLSGVLGAAGLGAMAGGFLNKGNPTAGSIGGGLGAGIGFAMGGPVGAIAGTVLGGIGSKLFGKKKPGTSASEFLGFMDGNGEIKGFSYGAKNAKGYEGYNKNFSEEFNNSLIQAKTALGIQKFKDVNIRGGINTLHSPSGQPGFLSVGDQHFGFNPDDANSRRSAINQALTIIAKNSGASDSQVTAMLNQLNTPKNPMGTEGMINLPAPAASNSTSFADFVTQYKASQNANAA